MKAGFVSIFGKPNAGKSTLLNALMGEKLAIVSSKVQTTRHRIKGIMNSDDYQVIISDTPGIIEPKYKLHEKMMLAVKAALEDADLALLLVDISDNWEDLDVLFSSLNLRIPSYIVVNKIDKVGHDKIEAVQRFFLGKKYCKRILMISALKVDGIEELKNAVIEAMPEGLPFFDNDDLSDLPTRFFVSEMIREKIFDLYEEEIPYHTTVLVTEFKEKTTLIKIIAEIIVQRETQKGILLGQGGKMIKALGSESRKEIEAFLGQKVFLELFVKVRPKWRDNDRMLKEFGYF